MKAPLASVGRIFLAVSLMALGIQNLYYKGILVGLQLTPNWLFWHTFWAYVDGIVLLAGGFCIAVRWKQRWGAAWVGILFVCSLLLLRVPRIPIAFHNIGERTALFETLAIGCGAWLVALHRSAWARVLIGISMIVFGIDHLLIPDFIATLIPAWIPSRLFWAWFTGLAFIAAGLSMVTRWQLRLASALLGLMFFLWVAVVHAPRVAASPHNPDEWNSLFVALALSGVCWILPE